MSLLSKIKQKCSLASEIIGTSYHKKLRGITVNRKNRRRLKNTGFSIISNDCTGAVMCHDLGVRFNSPFVNLWLYPEDYLKYCENMDYYNACELAFDISEEGIDYPLGRLDDIKIYFMHYTSEQEAKEKWNERINKDSIYFLFNDRNGCTEEHIKRFSALPYKNKRMFVCKRAEGAEDLIFLPCFEGEASVGVMSDFCNALSAKRYFDKFDYVDWINGGEN